VSKVKFQTFEKVKASKKPKNVKKQIPVEIKPAEKKDK
jgi:hypothetical protein